MNDLVWLKKDSWNDLQTLLKNIQIRQKSAIKKPAVHYTANGANSRIFLDIPGKKNYDGMFKVVYTGNDLLLVNDGLDMRSDVAGFAYINGDYKEIASEYVRINEKDLADKSIFLEDGRKLEVKEGFFSLVLDEKGNTFFAITAEIKTRIYDGEFAVEYDQKKDLLTVTDGSNGTSGFAGHAFLDGKWHHIPSKALPVKEGYFSLKYSAKGVTFEITDPPSIPLEFCNSCI